MNTLRQHVGTLGVLAAAALAGCAQGVEPTAPPLQHDAASSAGGSVAGGGGGSPMGSAGDPGGSGSSGGSVGTDDGSAGGGDLEDGSSGGGGDDASNDAAVEAGPVDAGSDGLGGASIDAGSPAPAPILHYTFDETTGSVAADSSSNHSNGTANGGYTWAAGKKGNAIKLDGVSGFVSLPAGIVSGLSDMTIATWVQLEVAADWQRILDFGNNNTVQMFLVPQNKETGVMRFAITTTGKTGQQLVNGPASLPVGVWKHVAIVLLGQTAQLYVDGSSAGTMSGFTLHPSSLGSTANNWIGRSQLAVDPYFKGMFDDFRVYDRALTAAQIAALASN